MVCREWKDKANMARHNTIKCYFNLWRFAQGFLYDGDSCEGLEPLWDGAENSFEKLSKGNKPWRNTDWLTATPAGNNSQANIYMP